VRVETPERVLENVGRRIIETRLRRGWTQEACADALEIDVRLLRRMEGGELNITVNTLVRLAQRLGVTTRALFEPAKFSGPRRPGRPRRVEVDEADIESEPAPPTQTGGSAATVRVDPKRRGARKRPEAQAKGPAPRYRPPAADARVLGETKKPAARAPARGPKTKRGAKK
jgi:transcriptional regulator with XRE-family HTH domain